jgi:hypothetical protein
LADAPPPPELGGHQVRPRRLSVGLMLQIDHFRPADAEQVRTRSASHASMSATR